MSRPLLVHVVGARPNYMKVAPVYRELTRRGVVSQRIVHTGQHYDPELKELLFGDLGLPPPDIELHVGSGSHVAQTAAAMIGLERALTEVQPDLVLVPGDVNSTLAGALAAVKLGMTVCHLESGLRSFDWTMPEEHNRRLTDHVSTLLLTHCEDADANLVAEGIPRDRIRFVGNTMIDTLLRHVDRARASSPLGELGVEPGSYVLVTLHRPALVDDESLLVATVEALADLASDLPVVFPMHPRTRARLAASSSSRASALRVMPPLGYLPFLALEASAAAVVTDSGGVQEETTALGVPCFTLRENTERPVTLRSGTNTLLGLDPGAIREIPGLLRTWRRPKQVPPLWDGQAGARAADAIEEVLSRLSGSLSRPQV